MSSYVITYTLPYANPPQGEAQALVVAITSWDAYVALSQRLDSTPEMVRCLEVSEGCVYFLPGA